MTVGNLPAPVLVKKPGALKELAAQLRREPVVAVDTESNSLYAYQEQVCLIQFSTPKVDYLVDPLALSDLAELGPIFKDPAIEKVFHAAEYDLICLKRDFGFEFNNLFDTMLAARILGREAFGLGALLEAEFGVELDKRFQRANWGQRPLPANLLAYARLDTHYLIALRDRLKAELMAENLWPLAVEDFQRMTEVSAPSLNGREPDCWRISGSYDLAPQQAAVLRELCAYRDSVARTLNRPLFKVVNDQTLVAIAAQMPLSMDALGQVPGMSSGLVQRHGKALLEAVRRGMEAEPIYPPRNPRPDESFIERLESLRRWRKNTAEDMGVKSDVVLPRDLLLALAEENPRQPEALAKVMSGVPWRLEHFGEDILRVLTR